ncbi:MAG: hypothetical protein O2794_04195 [bacterium]|nr:hypothetical protein [bacterium]
MGLEGIVTKIEIFVLNPLIYTLVVLSSLVFIWGVINTWVIGGDDPEKVAQGRRHIVWGIVGLVIMSVAFGIINLISSIYI